MRKKTAAQLHRAERQEEWGRKLREIKRECVRCGQTNYASLRLVDPETGRAIGLNARDWWRSPEVIAERLANAEVLCVSCQRIDLDREPAMDAGPTE